MDGTDGIEDGERGSQAAADADPPRGAAQIGPEDEKREELHGEPSAAEAVKLEARRKLAADA